jgi:hypothetical protein
VATEVAVRLGRILVLAVLVAALGAYLYLYEVPQAQREAQKTKLLAFEPEAVTGVTLAYPDRTIELRRGDQGWRLTAPVDAPADEAAVTSLLRTLADAEVQKTLDTLPEDLTAFGLAEPSVTVRLTLKEGPTPPPVAVGKNTPIGGRTYVRRGEERTLLLTSSSVQFGLKKQPNDLRNKQLLTFTDEDVTRIELVRAGGPGVVLTRAGSDEKGQTWSVEPGGHAADATEVRSYLSSLRAARAADFPADAPSDLAPYGLDEPRLTVHLGTSGAGGRQTLLLGSETTKDTQKQVYAKRGDQPTVYAIGEWSFRSLDKSAGDFRDKSVLAFEPDRVGRIAIERKDGEGVTIARTEKDGWQVVGAEDGPPETDTVRRFLDDVKELRGASIAAEPPDDLGAYGLDVPDLRIELVDRDEQPLGTILAARRDDKHYVMRGGGTTVFEAREYMYARLDKRRADFAGASATPAGTGAETADGD